MTEPIGGRDRQADGQSLQLPWFDLHCNDLIGSPVLLALRDTGQFYPGPWVGRIALILYRSPRPDPSGAERLYVVEAKGFSPGALGNRSQRLSIPVGALHTSQWVLNHTFHRTSCLSGDVSLRR